MSLLAEYKRRISDLETQLEERDAELEVYKKFIDTFEDWLIRDGRNQWKKKLKEGY